MFTLEIACIKVCSNMLCVDRMKKNQKIEYNGLVKIDRLTLYNELSKFIKWFCYEMMDHQGSINSS